MQKYLDVAGGDKNKALPLSSDDIMTELLACRVSSLRVVQGTCEGCASASSNSPMINGREGAEVRRSQLEAAGS